MTAWFLFRTAPHKECHVADRLRERSFEVYSPLKRIWRRPSRHVRRREYEERFFPLFPRYVFVLCEANPAGWGQVREERHVLSIVGIDGVPSPVPTEDLEDMRARFGEIVTGPKLNRWVKSRRDIPKGSSVRIVDGPWATVDDKPLVVEAVEGKAAIVYLNLFGGEVRTRVSLDHLQLAG